MLQTNTSRPGTREELIDFCLRQLGEPVTRVNVDPFQCDDCFEMAIQVWREFHFDASNLMYFQTKVSTSSMKLSNVNGTFDVGEYIEGSTTGSKTLIDSVASATELGVYKTVGTFKPGDVITGTKSGATATIDSIELGSYDNRYFDVPDSILSVLKIIPLSQRHIGDYMFDMRYQMFLNAIPTLTNFNLGYYTQLHSHLNLINDVLYGEKPVRHSRHLNRIYIDLSWEIDLAIGDTVIFEVHQYVGEDVSDIYNDWWLKRYLTALIKKMWGTNMKKFQGVTMPGGTTLNGQTIYDEAVHELDILYDELKNTYHTPTDFYIA